MDMKCIGCRAYRALALRFHLAELAGVRLSCTLKIFHVSLKPVDAQPQIHAAFIFCGNFMNMSTMFLIIFLNLNVGVQACAVQLNGSIAPESVQSLEGCTFVKISV